MLDPPPSPMIRANPHWHAAKHIVDHTKDLQPGLGGCRPLASYEEAMGGEGESYNPPIAFPDGTKFKMVCSSGHITLK